MTTNPPETPPTPDPLLDRVAVLLIRTIEHQSVSVFHSDEDLLAMFGSSARTAAAPLLEAVREIVRDEIRR